MMPLVANNSAIAVAAIGAAAAVATSWFTASATVDSQVSQIHAQVQVVEERENNHYLEVKGSLERIERKLDTALK